MPPALVGHTARVVKAEPVPPRRADANALAAFLGESVTDPLPRAELPIEMLFQRRAKLGRDSGLEVVVDENQAPAVEGSPALFDQPREAPHLRSVCDEDIGRGLRRFLLFRRSAPAAAFAG